MPRARLIVSNTLPYHVTARANNREHFHCDLDQVWRALTTECLDSHMVYESRVHALVLMPNHFHMLISTPNADLGQIMERFMKSLTKTLNRISGRSGRVFGDKYYRTLVDSSAYFGHAYKYLYRNPVKARLCKGVEDYRFSTLSGLLGSEPLHFPLYYPQPPASRRLIPEDSEALLQWLNRPFLTEHEEAIRRGLRKAVFAPPKQGWKRTLVDLSNENL